MNNNEAWQELFSRYDILKHIEENGRFEISADQIKELREPRLMTKFDHRTNLPELFLKNDLAILPVTRGDYVIAHFDAYHVLEQSSQPITRMAPPDNIQSLDYNNVPSEAIALNCALAAGIIADFLGEERIITTISGRMGTGRFEFNISDTKNRTLRSVSVSNAQMEIDAAYEGSSCMALFEAKLAKSGIFEDFMSRQLYYPFRVWRQRITKPLRPVFFVYSNEIFRLYEYVFEDMNNYSSIKLVRQKNYSVDDTSITSKDIQDVLRRTVVIPEPHSIPFPQADKFERVINLCELLNDRDMDNSEVTEEYVFTPRQTGYYTNSIRYLGLAEKKNDGGKTVYTLTEQGRKIMSMSYRMRQLSFCEKILSHKAFRETLALHFDRGYMPDTQEITEIMRDSGLHGVDSEETFRRRASTIRGWVSWIVTLITE